MTDIWTFPTQRLTSANTSINSSKVPAIFRRELFVPGTTNADIGGGRFDIQTVLLAEWGVRNVVFDPYNRSRAENAHAVELIRGGRAATATVSNVLNVIEEAHVRALVIAQAADAVGARGVAYFTVYQGNGSGVAQQTTKGWQENRKLATYAPEVQKHFGSVRVHHGLIEARP